MTAPPTSGPRHSLLDDTLFGVEADERERRLTLPGVLAALCRGEAFEFSTLQAHQQHAWHAFLVQLACLSLVRSGCPNPPDDETRWRQLLVRCAEQDGSGTEAFALVVPDLSEAAFMQPPVPEGTLSVLKAVHWSPSAELDVLVTSKNHDAKVRRLASPAPDHWAYGLVTLQTMQGFLGAGNYGIARMNGGFASRPCVAYAPSLVPAVRFGRDLTAMLDARESSVGRGFAKKGGVGLVWCASWDGNASLELASLDPYFIEICRRVRLSGCEDGLRAHRGSSKRPRIDAKALTGNTGDAWTPVDRNGKALTVPDAGFGYERVQDLMFGDWAHGVCGDRVLEEDRYWLGQVLVRGQGKTGGYHERWIPVPGRVRLLMANSSERQRLGSTAREWVRIADVARDRILRPALRTLLQGGPEPSNFLDHFGAEVDAVFFELLFQHAEDDVESANVAFAERLVGMAREELERATNSVPMSAARRHRAIAFAYRAFWRGIASARGFPSLPTRQTAPDDPTRGEDA
ncbi:MAG: type I-E CRISPR-associated protein Cse1/CasA [Proteobacteria bacterium]|nr:type I-E CRISPR-associated protein Cse1/CasA [Pseudomonadota bacterium]